MWNQRRFDYGDDPHINEDDLYKYRCIAQDIVEYSNEPLDVVVNSLVAYLYTIKKSSNKKMLWACFGWTIVENLRINTAQLNPICPFAVSGLSREMYASIIVLRNATRKQIISDALNRAKPHLSARGIC